MRGPIYARSGNGGTILQVRDRVLSCACQVNWPPAEHQRPACDCYEVKGCSPCAGTGSVAAVYPAFGSFCQSPKTLCSGSATIAKKPILGTALLGLTTDPPNFWTSLAVSSTDSTWT